MEGKKPLTEDIPEHVSWRVQDAWLAIPPCNYTEEPFCHVDCPYFSECNPAEEEGDMDEWDNYFEELIQPREVKT